MTGVNKSILEISDGDITFNLLELNPVGWSEALPEWKGGGSWNSSPFSNGEVLTARVFSNTDDAFVFNPEEPDQDLLMAKLRGLVSLLEKSVSFGITPWQNQPVWIKVQGACETNPMYALIRAYKILELDDPTFEPFSKGVIEGLTVAINHDMWQDCPPQTTVCVLTSAQQAYQNSVQTGNHYTPDVYHNAEYWTNGSGAGVTIVDIRGKFGLQATGAKPAIALTFEVPIPRRSKIVAATLNVVASTNQAVVNTVADITAERAGLNPLPLVGVTYQELVDRPRLTTIVTKTINVAWVAGNPYTLTNLSEIIQEAINQPEWEGSGGEITLHIEDNGSALGAYRDFDFNTGAVPSGPYLYVIWHPCDDVRGREETCEDEVILANKQHFAQITLCYFRTAAGVWTDIMAAWVSGVGAAFGAPAVAVGDAFYFGVDVDPRDGGPFHNVVLDFSLPQNLPLTYDIEFYDSVSAGWLPFAAATFHDGTLGMTKSGVGVISWIAPGFIDYAGGAVMGTVFSGPAGAIDAWWVRLVITAVPGALNQMNIGGGRLPYTCCWAFAEIGADIIKGDIVALAKTQFKGIFQSVLTTYQYNSFYLSVRSMDRGIDFSPYIILGDMNMGPSSGHQNPIGISTTPHIAGTTVKGFDDNLQFWGSPTGRRALYTPPGAAGMLGQLWVNWTYEAAKQYIGKYAVYLRYDYLGGVAGDFSLQLTWRFGLSSGQTAPVILDPVKFEMFIDYIDLGPGVAPDEFIDGYMLISIDDTTAAGPGTIYLYELILVPIDEFVVFVDRGLWNIASAYDTDRVIVDSIGLRKLGARTYSLQPPSVSSILEAWDFYMSGEWRFQKGSRQRIWYYGLHSPYLVGSIQNWANQQYLISRGDS